MSFRLTSFRLASAGIFAAMSVVPFAAAAHAADPVTDENRIVDLINAERSAAGLQPLAIHVQLTTTSRSWSSVMTSDWVASKEFNCAVKHDPALAAAGDGLPWRRLGENVGCGGSAVAEGFADMIHREFMNSPEHKKNIMNPLFDSVGIGIIEAGDVRFVTERFMDLDDRATSAPSTVPNELALAAPQVKAAVAVKPVTTKKPTVKTVKSTKSTKSTKGTKSVKAKTVAAKPSTKV
jgi:hypothetical protein